ncbi:hypothetical protein GGR52DRAFT_203788 [Hypoxylon sp. FL1284]|nr:hypothetical protein GGR52DRAFT_203788 [Hypoxylon sp. FL1284]
MRVKGEERRGENRGGMSIRLRARCYLYIPTPAPLLPRAISLHHAGLPTDVDYDQGDTGTREVAAWRPCFRGVLHGRYDACRTTHAVPSSATLQEQRGSLEDRSKRGNCDPRHRNAIGGPFVHGGRRLKRPPLKRVRSAPVCGPPSPSSGCPPFSPPFRRFASSSAVAVPKLFPTNQTSTYGTYPWVGRDYSGTRERRGVGYLV